MKNAAVTSNLKSKTFENVESFTLLMEKEKVLVNIQFYQKLFVIFISLTIFLILPESPRELENICANYNSRKLCHVW